MTTPLEALIEELARPSDLWCPGCGVELGAYRALGLPDGAAVCSVKCGMRYWRWAHEPRGALGPSQNWPLREGRLC